MSFTVSGLTKYFGKNRVLDNVSLSVERGELVSIIGPSGVGKTTLLKIIAGIENSYSGTIDFFDSDDEAILVFQDYILFPYMSVYENIAFGLKARKTPKEKITLLIDEMLDYFGLSDLAGSYPSQLSAGQKQRVALARAMVTRPAILLLDEPFANLDRNLKMETADFIRRTQQEFRITTVSVTHDLEEAFAMSDKIGIMLDGSIKQYGSVEDIYFNPSSMETARFLGPVNLIPQKLYEYFSIPCDKTAGKKHLIARAEALKIRKNPRGAAVVKEIKFIGILICFTAELAGETLYIYSLDNDIQKGDRVDLEISDTLKENEK
jgi:putative spermidine/putrescine transport system ATP-binding protein